MKLPRGFSISSDFRPFGRLRAVDRLNKSGRVSSSRWVASQTPMKMVTGRQDIADESVTLKRDRKLRPIAVAALSQRISNVRVTITTTTTF
jgi:hypothetical protein